MWYIESLAAMSSSQSIGSHSLLGSDAASSSGGKSSQLHAPIMGLDSQKLIEGQADKLLGSASLISAKSSSKYLNLQKKQIKKQLCKNKRFFSPLTI